MNKDEAIKILTEQKSKLEQGADSYVWTNTTCDLFKMIFPDSFEQKTKYLNKILFIPMYSSDPVTRMSTKNEGIKKACDYIDEFINEIKISENFKQKNKREENKILLLLKNEFFYGSLIVLMGATFTLGLYFGGNKFDSEKNNLYQENINYKAKNLKLKNENNDLKTKNINLEKTTNKTLANKELRIKTTK